MGFWQFTYCDFFGILATAIGLSSWYMAFWLCASSGSLPGLAGTVLPFSRRAGGMEQAIIMRRGAIWRSMYRGNVFIVHSYSSVFLGYQLDFNPAKATPKQ